MIEQLFNTKKNTRRFKLYYQQFNNCKCEFKIIAALKFIKVMNAHLDDPREEILECKSIAREINAIETFIEMLNRALSK